MTQSVQTFHLSWPPTANSMWRNIGGRVILSQPYRKWRKFAAQELMVARAKSIKGPVTVLIELYSPREGDWDVDNRTKPVLDLLVSNHVIEDDNYKIVREVISRVGSHVGARVTVTPITNELRPWLAMPAERAA